MAKNQKWFVRIADIKKNKAGGKKVGLILEISGGGVILFRKPIT